MPDRRRDKRYTLADPPDGALRIFLDVVVQQGRDDEWMALSREAAQMGETLVLDVPLPEPGFGDVRQRFPVFVVDSRPVIVDGDVRHQLRLQGGAPAPILFEQQIRRG